jgi:hypothetical protein
MKIFLTILTAGLLALPAMAGRECVELTVEAPPSVTVLPDQAQNLTVTGEIKNCGDEAGNVEMSVELIINGHTVSISNSTPQPLGAGESAVRTVGLPIPQQAQEGLQKALVSVSMDGETVVAQEVLVNLINGDEPPGPPSASAEKTVLKNYPNPFNASTSINFNLSEDGKVKLEVFNILGQKVRTLVDQNMNAGTHQVVWDGTDQSGKSVGSGVYFYRLNADKSSLTKRMQLIK